MLNAAGAEIEISVLSTRGGVDKKKLAIGPRPQR